MHNMPFKQMLHRLDNLVFAAIALAYGPGETVPVLADGIPNDNKVPESASDIIAVVFQVAEVR